MVSGSMGAEKPIDHPANGSRYAAQHAIAQRLFQFMLVPGGEREEKNDGRDHALGCITPYKAL